MKPVTQSWLVFSGAVSKIGEAIHCCPDIEEVDHYVRWLFIRTRNKLRDRINWLYVQAVAEALIEKRRMTSREVRQVMDEAMKKWMKRESERMGK